jgi:hypothetical protein
MRHFLVQDSDNIHSIGFEGTGYLVGALEVVFKADVTTVYRYEKVAYDQFVEMLGSESIGKAFAEKFKKTKHPFTKSIRTDLDKQVGTKTLKK